MTMEPGLKVRRARRQDFEQVRALLGAQAPAARAERKRFRRLVSTLREDLYLAERERDAAVVGLAVVAYARGLGPPTAVVRRLLAPSSAATRLLLDSAYARAAARGCASIELQLEPDPELPDLMDRLRGAGWTEGPRTLVRRVGLEGTP
jgi:hypothetical protein